MKLTIELAGGQTIVEAGLDAEKARSMARSLIGDSEARTVVVGFTNGERRFRTALVAAVSLVED